MGASSMVVESKRFTGLRSSRGCTRAAPGRCSRSPWCTRAHPAGRRRSRRGSPRSSSRTGRAAEYVESGPSSLLRCTVIAHDGHEARADERVEERLRDVRHRHDRDERLRAPARRGRRCDTRRRSGPAPRSGSARRGRSLVLLERRRVGQVRAVLPGGLEGEGPQVGAVGVVVVGRDDADGLLGDRRIGDDLQERVDVRGACRGRCPRRRSAGTSMAWPIICCVPVFALRTK